MKTKLAISFGSGNVWELGLTIYEFSETTKRYRNIGSFEKDPTCYNWGEDSVRGRLTYDDRFASFTKWSLTMKTWTTVNA